MLYAFDSSHLPYDSQQNPSRDRAGLALHFNIPTIMNGHVYVERSTKWMSMDY
jgi:hypothetical protein